MESPENTLVITGASTITAAGVGACAVLDAMAERRDFFDRPAYGGETCARGWATASVAPEAVVWPSEPWWANNRKYASFATELAVTVTQHAIAAADRASMHEAAQCGVVITARAEDEEPRIMPSILSRVLAEGADRLATLLFEEVPDYTYVRQMVSLSGQFVAEATGFRGSNVAVYSDASAAGIGALELAARLLQSGELERAIVVGVAPPATAATLRDLDKMDKLAVDALEGRGPFDARRAGRFIASGAAALVLETEACALRRGKTPLGRLVACLTTYEGSGKALPLAVDFVLRRALARPAFWWAHGTASVELDRYECATVGAQHIRDVPVTSSKGTIGDACECAALIDIALALESLRSESVPPIGLLQTPDPTLGPIDFVVGAPRTLRSGNTALVTSLGHDAKSAGAAVIARDSP